MAQDPPRWPPGTVAVLATSGAHAIPVSTAVPPDADGRVLLALGPRRDSLRRLREDPAASLTVLAEGDVALTLHGRAEVLADPLPGAEPVVAVALHVDAVQDHGSRRFQIDGGVRWHWTDPESERRDRATRDALRRLAGQ